MANIKFLKENTNIKWMSLIFTAKQNCIGANLVTIKEQMSLAIEKAQKKYA